MDPDPRGRKLTDPEHCYQVNLMRTHDSPDVHFPVHMHCKGTILTSDRKIIFLNANKSPILSRSGPGSWRANLMRIHVNSDPKHFYHRTIAVVRIDEKNGTGLVRFKKLYL
jgi:hypothetical protein